MEEAWLRSRLESGRSIESIAREVGKAPSTVAYWAAKYGLASAHAAKHAPRGGIDRDTLRELVDGGLSTRALAERLGVSQATVRHWLARHGGLAVPPSRPRREGLPHRASRRYAVDRAGSRRGREVRLALRQLPRRSRIGNRYHPAWLPGRLSGVLGPG